MKLNSLLFLLIFFYLLSCKKTEKESVFFGLYQSVGTLSIEEPVMYVSNKIITDTITIQNFLTSNQINYIKFNTQSERDTISVSIDFTDSGRVNVAAGNKVDKTKILSKTNNEFTLANLDSIWRIKDYPDPRCMLLPNLVNKTQVTESCVTVPSGSNFNRLLCTYKWFHHLEINNDKLTMPVLSLVTKAEQCGVSLIDVWMKHNSNLSSLLVAGDTIVLQIKKRNFNKK